MGWLRAVRNKNTTTATHTGPELDQSVLETRGKIDSDTNNASHIGKTLKVAPFQPLPFADENTPDSELPFLSAAQVALTRQRDEGDWVGHLYLVIDNIVYNCTQFVHEHPGGTQVIESFRGQDCTWQFWRFHSKDNMKTWGRPLRVARTQCVENKWKERPRFVGLRTLGAAAEQEW